MAMNKYLILATLAAAAMLTPAAHAQNILDEQLNGPPAKADPAKPQTPAPAVKPDPTATPATPPAAAGQDVINPNAVKNVDDADLINKLTQTGDAPKEGPPVAQKMKDMIERMGQSETRLVDKDPGAVTQETQRRIVADLDVLIEFARQQQQSGPSDSKNQQQQQGQERTYSQGQGPQNQGGTNAATASILPRGDAATPQLNDDIHSRGPSEWGDLRPRERDLISHGANEQYLSSYRDMIDRYYQALAELGKSKNR